MPSKRDDPSKSAEPARAAPVLDYLGYHAPDHQRPGPRGSDVFNGVVSLCFSVGWLGLSLAFFYAGTANGGNVLYVLAGVVNLLLACGFGRATIYYFRRGIDGNG